MNKISGVLSLLLICIACAIGFFEILMSSVVFAATYTIIAVSGSFLIIFSFCAKCECRSDACGHIVPGKLTNLFPDRDQTDYSIADYFLTSISLLLVIGFPQFWLWKNSYLFITFWVLIIITLVMILSSVCKKCENTKCPLCKKTDRLKN
jgi:hypothetical protein